jgi:hypothetical protein
MGEHRHGFLAQPMIRDIAVRLESTGEASRGDTREWEAGGNWVATSGWVSRTSKKAKQNWGSPALSVAWLEDALAWSSPQSSSNQRNTTEKWQHLATQNWDPIGAL